MTKSRRSLHGNVLLYGLRERMTDEQEAMVDSVLNNRMTVVNAKAGTGKTTIAVAMAKYLYETTGQPCVFAFGTPQERTLGYRPGTTAEKELDYLAPLIGALRTCGEQDPMSVIQQAGDVHGSPRKWIEAGSHTFMRGINLEGKTVIVEETQNLTRSDLKKILTRIHDNCTVIMIGHTGQCDLAKTSTSGFLPYLDHYKDEWYCDVIELTKSFRGELAEHADALEWED